MALRSPLAVGLRIKFDISLNARAIHGFPSKEALSIGLFKKPLEPTFKEIAFGVKPPLAHGPAPFKPFSLHIKAAQVPDMRTYPAMAQQSGEQASPEYFEKK
jgi:hypothetical protein